jgi:hypothetical protein
MMNLILSSPKMFYANISMQCCTHAEKLALLTTGAVTLMNLFITYTKALTLTYLLKSTLYSSIEWSLFAEFKLSVCFYRNNNIQETV